MIRIFLDMNRTEAAAESRAGQDASHGAMQIAVRQEIEETDAAGLGQVELDARPGASVASQERGDEALHGLGRRADPKASDLAGGERAGPLADRIGPGQHVAAPFQQVLTFGGELDPATDAVEETKAELGLEVTDLPRESRLRDMDSKRGLRHAGRIDHADKVAEMPQLHRRSMPGEHGL